MWKSLTALLILALVLVTPSSLRADEPAVSYGAKVAYRKGAALKFPDFAVTYLGERQLKATKTYPRDIPFHDFRITHGTTTQTVSWSSGTGDIGPAHFTVAGKSFTLELRFSDKLGKLRDNEVVIQKR